MKVIAEGISSKLTESEKAAIRFNIGLDEYHATIKAILGKAYYDLDFSNNLYYFVGSNGLQESSLTSSVSVVRNSAGVYYSPLKLISVIVNSPRITYDPLTGNNIGLLVEEQRTNLLLHSQYTAANGETPPTDWTIGVNTGVTTTSASLRFSGANRATHTGSSQREFYTQNVTLAANTTYTLSCYFETGTSANGFLMQAISSGGDTPTGSTAFSSATPLEGGVYSMTFTTGSTGGAYGVRIGLGCNANATGTVIHETPQLEVGSTYSSYIPTTTAAAPRQADQVTRTVIEIQKGSILCLCAAVNQTPAANNVAFALSDATANNRVMVRRNSSAAGSQFSVVSAGVTVASVTTAQKASAKFNAFGISFKANLFLGSEDGVTVMSSTSGAMPTGLTQLTIGSLGPAFSGAEALNGTIKRIIYIPQALTELELNTITNWLKYQ